MPADWSVSGVSRWQALQRAHRTAITQGLVAAGNVGRNAIRRALRGGYLSSLGNKGDFVTGTSLGHVTLGEPVITAQKSSISVGTDLLFNLFWEIGHHNIFTRHYERDEKWAPAWRDARQGMTDAFNRVYKRAIQAAAASGSPDPGTRATT